MQKSVVFPQTNNKLSKGEIKEKNPTYNLIKKHKIPRNKTTYEIIGIYLENNKMLMKEIEDDTNRWKDIT